MRSYLLASISGGSIRCIKEVKAFVIIWEISLVRECILEIQAWSKGSKNLARNVFFSLVQKWTSFLMRNHEFCFPIVIWYSRMFAEKAGKVLGIQKKLNLILKIFSRKIRGFLTCFLVFCRWAKIYILKIFVHNLHKY